MVMVPQYGTPSEQQSQSWFPTDYTILFVLVIITAALTWIVPAGEYERTTNSVLGKDVPVPGTYAQVDAAPQGLLDVQMAPIAGFYDPTSYTANAIDVSLFVLIVGGFSGVVTATGAINTGVAQAMRKLEGREKWMIPILFSATFVIMVWGVSSQGWWMAEMSALFLGAAIVIGTLGSLGEKVFTNAFVEAARDLLGVALVIGLARGIVIIMDQGWISGMPQFAFVNAMFGIEALMSFLVPSTSGLAVLSMPTMAPLSDFAGVSRELAVTAFQTAIGITNLIALTYAAVVGGLAIGRVPYNTRLHFVWPLLANLSLMAMPPVYARVML